MVKAYRRHDDADPVEERDLDVTEEFWVARPGEDRRYLVKPSGPDRWTVFRQLGTITQPLGHVEREGQEYVGVTGSGPGGQGTTQDALLAAIPWVLSGS